MITDYSKDRHVSMEVTQAKRRINEIEAELKSRSYTLCERRRAIRNRLLKKQGGKCCMCGEYIKEYEIEVLDHFHLSGQCRGTAHAECNILEGRISKIIDSYNPGELNFISSTYLRNIADLYDKGGTDPDTGEQYPDYPGHELLEEMRDLKSKIPVKRGRPKKSAKEVRESNKAKKATQKRRDAARKKQEKQEAKETASRQAKHFQVLRWNRYIDRVHPLQRTSTDEAKAENPDLSDKEIRDRLKAYGFKVDEKGVAKLHTEAIERE
jgi:hypothetical protein